MLSKNSENLVLQTLSLIPIFTISFEVKFAGRQNSKFLKHIKNIQILREINPEGLFLKLFPLDK